MTLQQVEQELLAPTGLDEAKIGETLATIASRDVDYADIYFQSSWHETLVLKIASSKMVHSTSIVVLAFER